MSSKNSHPGKRWIPQTTECMRGWGESWESRMPAWSATEWADWVWAKKNTAKKRQAKWYTSWFGKDGWQHLMVQRLMSEIYPHTVVGQLVSCPSRHVGWGRLITVLLLAWHSLGKPRSEDEVGVRASEVWERLWLHQILGHRRGGWTR